MPPRFKVEQVSRDFGAADIHRHTERTRVRRDVVAQHTGIDTEPPHPAFQLQSLLISERGAWYVHTRVTLQVRSARKPLAGIELFLTQGLILRRGRCRYVFTQYGYTATTT